MAVYLTGDTHNSIDVGKLSVENWPAQKELTENDYLIVLGDFGFIWNDQPDKNEQWWLEWFDNKPFTTLFIDGNHDNHNRIALYPTEELLGGTAQRISKKVWHLMRGEIYTIDDKTFWCMGGANSHDISDGILDLSKAHDRELYQEWKKNPNKMFRVLNVDWWEKEVPNEGERLHGEAQLMFRDYKVDFVLTHDAPASFKALLGLRGREDYSIWLEEMRQKIEYGKWYCGHLHIDYAINDKDIVLYDKIVQVA